MSIIDILFAIMSENIRLDAFSNSRLFRDLLKKHGPTL
jgi:hypothetical protein